MLETWDMALNEVPAVVGLAVHALAARTQVITGVVWGGPTRGPGPARRWKRSGWRSARGSSSGWT